MSLRLDRLLTLYFFSPLAKLFPRKKGIRIPILMYHSISDEKETGHPYFWINTSPARFSEHMQFLHDNHYRVISLSEAVDIIRSISPCSMPPAPCSDARNPQSDNAQLGTRNPERPLVLNPEPATRNKSSMSLSRNPQPATRNKSSMSLSRNPQPANRNDLFPAPSAQRPAPGFVVLTFDDGYGDFCTHAFPVLKKYGFPATVYLPTAFIDSHKPGLKGKRHLSWAQVKELQNKGIEFGSHTVNHPQLYGLGTEIIESEIKGSKLEIEDKTGREVRSLSYPYKFPEQDNDFIEKYLIFSKGAGYENGVSTRIGTIHRNDEVFFLKRIPANSADHLPFFQAKLEGSYDWLSSVQNLSKKLRGTPKNKGYSFF